jgi:hypothetical protein
MEQLVDAVDRFSNALWLDAMLEFVPRAPLLNLCVVVDVALHQSDRIPSSNDELKALPSCSVLISGQEGRLPDVMRYPIPFSAHFISPLIKPAPLQMKQAAISFTTLLVGDTDELNGPDCLFDVFVRGTVSAGGSA